MASETVFSVARFDTSFIADPDGVDVSAAQCVVNDSKLDLIDVLIEGAPADIRLEWRTASQGFEIIEVRQ